MTVIDRSLRLLLPVTPFLTEELWQRLPGRERIHATSICLAPYPQEEPIWNDPSVEDGMDRLMRLIGWIRNQRAELGITHKIPLEVVLETEDKALGAFLEEQEPLAKALARLGSWRLGKVPTGASEGMRRDLVAGVQIGLVVPEREVTQEDRQRLAEELERLEGQIAHTRGLLANEQFVAKAPAKVVEQNRERLRDLEERVESIRAGLGD